MTTIERWRVLFLVSLGIVTPVCLAEFDPSDIHQTSAVYGDPDRPDRILQTLDVYQKRSDIRSDSVQLKPAVIYIHGGGWFFGDKADVFAKPAFFLSHDMVFISANYRLQAEYSLLDQLEDVASTISYVQREHRRYQIDPSKIILIGHEAGAHLVSLIATDPRYLRQVGLSPSAITGVVAINSIAYDVVHRMANSDDYLEQRRLRLAFGDSEEVWRTVSPVSHVASETDVQSQETSLPAFALLHVAEDESQTEQARRFSRALQAAGSYVLIIPANSKTRDTIDQELGTPGDRTSLALMAFLRAKL